MGFDKNNPDKQYDKQNINLSETAIRTVEEDMFLFNMKFATLVNTVFRNYRDNAAASVELFLRKEAYGIHKTLNVRIPNDNELREIIKNVISDKYDRKNPIQINLRLKFNETDGIISKYPKYISKKFRIDNENVDYLISDKRCNEEVYYRDNIGKYLKAIIEEYSRLTYAEREKIIFKHFVDAIEKSINDKIKIGIETGGKSFVVSPYQLMENKERTYTYLAAIGEDGASCCFRLSGINKINPIPVSRSFIDSIVATEKIKEDIEKKTIQFLTDDVEEIVVKMTDAGVRMYKSIHHLRPEYTSVKGDLFFFSCTYRQAEYYFFNFGENATIIKPDSLASSLKERYYNAYKQYV